ncbi:MAG: response regulator [Polyangiaceae bacterium]|nr:response regulator [Polyangiaceae bacterium]
MAEGGDPGGRLHEVLYRRVRELTLLHTAGRVAWDRRAGTSELIGPIVEELPSILGPGGQAVARLTWGSLQLATAGFDRAPAPLRSAGRLEDGSELVIEVGRVRDLSAAGRLAASEASSAADERDAQSLLDAVRDVLALALATRRAHDRLELVLAATGAGLWEWDVADRRFSLSADVEMLLGVGPGDLDGTLASLRRHVHPADRRRALGVFRRAIASPSGMYRDELRIVDGDGGARWLAVSGQVLWSESGGSRIAGMVVDVTPRRALEEQLRQGQRMEAVAALSAGIAHDFNNALSVVLAYTGFAVSAIGPDSPAQRDLGEVRAAAERAAGLTRRLLIFARQQPVEPRPIEVNDTVQGLARLVRSVVGDAIAVEVALGEGVGPVVVDPGLIDEVVMNLAVSARDAMPAGGRLVIATRAEAWEDERGGFPHGRYVCISVSDTGGPASASLGRPRVEPTRGGRAEAAGGSLALSAVRAAVQRAGGHVEISVGPAGGRVGVVRFREAAAATAWVRRSTRPAAPPPGHPAGGGGTALVVEDDDQVRALVAATLRRAGYSVIELAGAGDALLVAEQRDQALELLVADVGLPRVSGLELARRARRARPELPVLLVSGAGEPPGLAELGEGVSFLAKPLLPGELVAAARALVGAATAGARLGEP